ncbi:MAG: hypothetical protein P8I55_14175 [Crocinitomix sp.]|nr:hypothetical protein [Crocinitomix sp.]
MVRTLLIAFILGLSFNSFSMRKKKQLALIESCKILSEKRSIFAGTSMPVTMSFALETGEVVYSNKGARFGFRDFNISISGSGKRKWCGKRKMTLGSYYNALNDPYIHINAQMIEKPEISYSISILIHFKGRYSSSHNGSTGDCGLKGHNGHRGNNGRGEYRNDDGKDGQNGEHGYNGNRGARGHDANNVEVYVSRVDFPRDENNLLHIQRISG